MVKGIEKLLASAFRQPSQLVAELMV